jgi:phosphate-selective porin
MGTFTRTAAALAVAATIALVPAPAQANAGLAEAEKLQKLDIMLMVSSLVCRFGADNFQSDYSRFSTAHRATMNAAGAALQRDMVARHGAAAGKKALDRISVRMANEYGQGHPWMGCGELKTTTNRLAQVRDRAALLGAADELLGRRPVPAAPVLAAR